MNFTRLASAFLTIHSLLFSSDNDRFSLVGEGSLRIQRILEDDSGLYTCRATNAEDAVDASAVVSVLGICMTDLYNYLHE